MKLGLAFLLFVSLLSAQTLTLTGPASVKQGKSVTLNLGVGGPVVAAGLQWTVGLPVGFTATSVIGGAGTTAAKTLYCTSDAALCLLVGMNTTAIGNGTVAVYSLAVPSTATLGANPIPLSGLVAVNAAGGSLAITPGATYSILVLAKQDINGDGVVDNADVQLMIDQVRAARTNPAACVDDMNADGKCDLVDVFNVVLKALGL